MSKHTQGPWTKYEEDDSGLTVWIDGDCDDGQTICICKLEEYSRSTMRANAALIAAAPDMLAALRRLFKACGHLPIEATPESAEVMMAGLDAVRAIKKATGEDP